MKSIVLTGGGTAGHIMPHLALLPYLQKNFSKIYYIGSFNGMEKNLIKQQENISYFGVTTTKLIRKFTLKNLLIPFQLLKGIREAKKHLKHLMPSVVFSKGGFVSLPVVIAAKKLKIPVVSHESDITLGLANKIIYHYSKVLCTSFESTAHIKKRMVYTGSPIREQIFNGNKNLIIEKYSLNKEKSTLLFIGGSLGAKTINELVFENISDLIKEYNVLHITGKNNKNFTLNNVKGYIQTEFVNDIENFYACADCVISRAGSNVIFELLVLKKPMLLIPLPKGESRGDQILNANYMKEKGYAKVLMQEDLTSASLKQKIHQTILDKNSLVKNMTSETTSNGNENIIKQILKYSL